ncbi:hypothetical protein PM082_021511 [Marasmius tenuissimus]|nr:hypothetical protein PM082_021511 [Marasmius tenuissimus]
MTSSHPTFFPGSFNDPSMAFFQPTVYNQDDPQQSFSPSHELQSEQQYFQKSPYHQGGHYSQPLDSPQYLPDTSLSSGWQSWTSVECSSPQAPAYNSGLTKLSLLSWPVECFVTSDPSFANNDSELLSSLQGTPDLLYSASSVEDGPNVFDIQFGQSLKATPVYGYPAPLSPCSASSPISSTSSSPISREGTVELTKRPHAHIRTPSPSRSDSAPPSSADYRRRFPCLLPGCERRFTSRYTLKVHMEAHKPKPKVTFPCTQGCSERFSRQHDRLRHEVAKHGKICEFLCDDCGRFFSTSKTLGNHKCPVAASGTRWVHSSS